MMMKKKISGRILVVVMSGLLVVSMNACKKNSAKEPVTNKATEVSTKIEYVTDKNGEVETVTKKVVEKVTNAAGQVETRTTAAGKIEEVTKEVVITEPVTKISTVKSENTTKASSVATTDKATEKKTEKVTEKETEPVTQTPTEAPTEAKTEAPTEAPTQTPTVVEPEPVPDPEPVITYPYEVLEESPNNCPSYWWRYYEDGRRELITDYRYYLTEKDTTDREVILEWFMEGFNDARATRGLEPITATMMTPDMMAGAQAWADVMASDYGYAEHSEMDWLRRSVNIYSEATGKTGCSWYEGVGELGSNRYTHSAVRSIGRALCSHIQADSTNSNIAELGVGFTFGWAIPDTWAAEMGSQGHKTIFFCVGSIVLKE